ncbi:MAG: hypothetical protein P4L40_05440 [Terracidiphilus sp.]|nr:hypothetical protein [Terracidiphilus sp.]
MCVCAGVITGWSVSVGSRNAQKFGSLLPSLPTTVIGHRANTTVCSVSVVTPPPATVTEGVPFATQPRVRVLDANGAGVPGKVR